MLFRSQARLALAARVSVHHDPALDAGRFAMRVTNIGVLGNAFFSKGLSFDPSFEFPKGSGQECLEHAELWVGAKRDDGSVHVSGGPMFDLDGLLLDTEPLHGQAWQQAASHFGRPLLPEELLALRGRAYLSEANKLGQADFEEAIRLNPRNPNHFHGLARARVRLGEHAAAIACYRDEACL